MNVRAVFLTAVSSLGAWPDGKNAECLDGFHLLEYSETHRESLCRILSERSVFTPLYPQLHPLPSVREIIADWTDAPTSPCSLQLAVLRVPDDRLIGCVRVDRDNLSYFIDRELWRCGYGARAVKWVTENVLRNVRGATFQAITDRSNVASIKLLENAGFAFAGIYQPHACGRTLLHYRLTT